MILIMKPSDRKSTTSIRHYQSSFFVKDFQILGDFIAALNCKRQYLVIILIIIIVIIEHLYIYIIVN